MGRSFRPQRLVLTWTLALLPAWPVLATNEPSQSPNADKPAVQQPAQRPIDNGKLPEIDRSEFFELTGEEPLQPFVPAHPRTVEDRKRIEALAAFSVARALENKRSWAEAIVVLEEALRFDPESITILRRLSKLCFFLGRTEPGIQYSKRVLAVDPGDTETISRLVAYFTRRNEPAAAESVLKDVLANAKLEKTSPGRLLANFELGRLYEGKLRNVEKAADVYAKVIEALDDKAANRLSQVDQRRILGAEESAVYLDMGLVFLEAKRNDLAIKAFERGLNYEPDDPQLPLLLAQTLLKVDRGNEALVQVEQFLKRQPQGAEGYELLVKILKALKRETEITTRLEEAAKNDSKNVTLQYALADHYREIGKIEQADAMYKSLLASQPTAQAYSALAASLLKRKKAEELVKVIFQAIARQQANEGVREQIDSIGNDPVFAEQVLDAGLKLLSADNAPIDRNQFTILAFIANRAHKIDRFLPIQMLALKRNPNAQTYKEVIGVLAELRKFPEAIANFEELFKKFPEERNARQLIELAKIDRMAEKTDEAIKNLREAYKLDASAFDALLLLALTLRDSGKADEAVTLLRDAQKKDPNNPAYGSILGSVLAQSGRNEEAMNVLKGLIEKYPNNDEVLRTARSNLSIIYVNMGDYTKGEAELEILLEKNPDEPQVNNDLGYLYAEQGKNLEKAEVMIRKALEEKPEESAYLDSLGWVLFKRGKAKDAVDPLEKAVKNLVEVSSTDATIFEHLGDVYFQLQENAKAKSAWQSAEKAASKANPPDKRLPEIRKKLQSLEKLGQLPKPSSGNTP